MNIIKGIFDAEDSRFFSINIFKESQESRYYKLKFILSNNESSYTYESNTLFKINEFQKIVVNFSTIFGEFDNIVIWQDFKSEVVFLKKSFPL